MIEMSLQSRIIKWNKDHNKLNYNLELETRMLSEEANEFFIAETYPEKLQEAADFMFVFIGTQAKFFATKRMMELSVNWDEFLKLRTWANLVLDKMFEVLADEAHTNGLSGKETEMLLMALEHVTKANELKGVPATYITDGKIEKGDAYVSPLPKIIADVEDAIVSTTH